VKETGERGEAGWCTYPDGLEDNPEIEVFCGAENERTPAGAACWRQGHLLHFAFEQSPAQMNEAGQRLLLNSIAYISRFTEDRPIAVTPSVFGGPTACPRVYLDRSLGERGDLARVAHLLSPKTAAELQRMGAAAVRLWHAQNRPYLHPSAEQKLEMDVEARALGVPFDRLEWFDKMIGELRGGGQAAQVAARLLARYAPIGACSDNSVTTWEQWFKENRAYLFFSEQGDYRWYVDPLAKKRGVPSKQLRGPARASRP